MSERDLKICEFNLENLFISMEYYRNQNLHDLSETEWREIALPQLRRKQKPLFKLWGISRAILDIDPDVLMLTEVGGRDSLENFNRYFLNDQFIPHFVEGNSKRNIDLGFLVKRTLAYRAETLSNRDLPIEVHTFHGRYLSRFSRDVAELWLYDGNDPKIILLLVHLKSKLSTELDFQGKDVRTAEAIALANLYRSLRARHPEVPIVIAGDFNTSLESLELELLKHTDLTDFHDHLGTPTENRVTLVHFDHSGNPQPMILDYLLLSPHLVDRIVASGSRTYRYKGFYEIPEEPPRNLRERNQMPSDHFPVVLTLRL